MKNDRNAMNHFDFMNSYPNGFVSFFSSFNSNISYSTSHNCHNLETYLQNTTKEVRLNGFALLYVHRDISLDFEQVIAEFSRKNRRLNFN